MSKKLIVSSTEFVRNPSLSEEIEPDRFAPMTGRNNYRSANIVSYNQLKMLKKKYGIKRVVNLALDSVDFQADPNFNCAGRKVPCEPFWAESLGLEYYPFYLTKYAPSQERWEIMKDLLAQGDTLIHCTHGVDRTGAIAGAWRKTVEPNLSDRDILENYTYKFGGAWRSVEDSNRHLRRFIQDVQYDPNQELAIRKKIEWWVFASIGVVSIPLMLILLKKNKVI